MKKKVPLFDAKQLKKMALNKKCQQLRQQVMRNQNPNASKFYTPTQRQQPTQKHDHWTDRSGFNQTNKTMAHQNYR